MVVVPSAGMLEKKPESEVRGSRFLPKSSRLSS